jgi:hypothetical protein
MPKFLVQVTRWEAQTGEAEIEAPNRIEANRIAREDAARTDASHHFSQFLQDTTRPARVTVDSSKQV